MWWWCFGSVGRGPGVREGQGRGGGDGRERKGGVRQGGGGEGVGGGAVSWIMRFRQRVVGAPSTLEKFLQQSTVQIIEVVVAVVKYVAIVGVMALREGARLQ